MRRQNTTRIGDIIKEVIRNEGLEEGLLIARVADAWDTVVGDRKSTRLNSSHL